MKIEEISAIQILDSRANPTLKVTATVEGARGSFSVPSGASTGAHEALELRDGGLLYSGLGVSKAVGHVNNEIAKLLIGKDPRNQLIVDGLMIDLDGTDNKATLGANAILGASVAIAVATAKALKLPLYRYLQNMYENDGVYQDGWKPKKKSLVMPKMYFNVLNGGKHADNNVDIQESMIVPLLDTVSENVRVASEVYHALKKILISRGFSTGLGDEGGFAPSLESNTKALELLVEAIEKAGYKPGEDVAIALDVAASEIFNPEKDNKYILSSEAIGLSSQQICSWYKELVNTYPIISIEDGLAEDDWAGWKLLTERIGDTTQLVGDDLFVTNPKRIQEGIDKKVANAVLIKLNQIGSLSETFAAIRLAAKAGYRCMLSHRSGETPDTFIADLVVATGAGEIKSGAPARGERVAKYNRLLVIEQELNKN